jgi:hypothetical protein
MHVLSQVEQMKKKSKAKSASKKEEKSETAAESSKAEDTVVDSPAEPTTPEVDQEETKLEEGSESKDAEETITELSNTAGQRQSSLSIQSKMRSSSFRQSSGGPLSPGYGFSPDGDTAPDIYRKQAVRIEELEKENKKLLKDVSDGERRWKKAEEELEDIREAEDGPASIAKETSGASGSSDELEKLVLSSPMNHTICTDDDAEIRNSLPKAPKYAASSTNISSQSARVLAICLYGYASQLRGRVSVQILYDRIYGNRDIQSPCPGRTSKCW